MIPHTLSRLVLAAACLCAGAALRPLPTWAAEVSPAEAIQSAARALASGDPEGALVALPPVPGTGPAPAWAPGAHLLRATALLRAGRPAEALPALDRAEAGLPALADLIRLRRADALRAAGQPAAAAGAFDRLLRESAGSPWAPEAAAALGAARAEAGDLAGAVAADRSYLESRPPADLADAVRLRLGASLEALGRPGEAEAVYRTLVVERPLVRAADEALARLARLRGPKAGPLVLTSEERLIRGLVLFDAYRSAEALRDLEAVDLSRVPGGEEGPAGQEVRLKRGLALFRMRRYHEAARALAPLAGVQGPTGEEARFWRARALARQGRSREAIAEFTAIAEATPESRYAGQASYLAAVVLDDQGEKAEAAARFRALADRLGKSPLAADALWQVAWGRYRAGDLAGAEDAFVEMMRRFAGTDAADRALYWRARAELRLGRPVTAVSRLADLVSRRPLSYYGIQAARRLDEFDREAAAAAQAPPSERPVTPEPACCRLPGERAVASPLARAALLVDLGLLAEARTEVLAVQRNGRDVPALEAARLLHAAGDYSRPLAIARGMAGLPLERLALDPERRLFPLAFPRGYRAAVEAEARAARVSEHLAYAVIRAESLFDPSAISPVGARGLMQLMPTTADGLAQALGARVSDPDDLFAPGANVRLGITLLGRLLARYPGRPYLAIAAYNAGPEAVNRWVRTFGDVPEDEFVESIPYSETRGYVMKVVAFWRTYDALY